MTTINTRRTRIPPYRFTPEVRAATHALHKLDNYHGLLAWASDVTWIGGAIAAAVAAGRVGAFWPVYLMVTLPVIATRQRALATLLHESAHGILARKRRLNRLLGTYLSGYWILQSFGAYFRSHVVDHHGHFGDPDRDPDLRGHIAVGLYGRWPRAQFVRRFLLRPLVASQVPELLRLAGSRLVYRRSPDWTELIRMMLFVGASTTMASFAAGASNVLLFWFVPLTVGFPVVNWYIELLEHFPLPAFATSSLEATRHRAVGRISRHFFGIHNEGFHLDHHLSPRVPFWNMPALHALRMTDPVYAVQVVKLRGNRSVWQQFVQLVDERPTVSPEMFVQALAYARGNDAWLTQLILRRIEEQEL